MVRPSRSTLPWVSILRAIWFAILVGLAVEIVCLALQTGLVALPPAAAILADTLQRVSWSVLVCAGLAAGVALPRVVRSRALRPTLGLVGFLSAPGAFAAARAIHQAVAHALTGDAGGAAGTLVFATAGIRAVEYGAFGFLVARLVQTPPPQWRRYASLGAVIGVAFGAITLAATAMLSAATPTVAVTIVRAANEVIFPVGCALVLYVTTRTTSWVAAAREATAFEDQETVLLPAPPARAAVLERTSR